MLLPTLVVSERFFLTNGEEGNESVEKRREMKDRCRTGNDARRTVGRILVHRQRHRGMNLRASTRAPWDESMSVNEGTLE